MYTELYLGIELKKDVHEDIIKHFHSYDDSYEDLYIPDGMPSRLHGLGGSAYFDAIPTMVFKKQFTGENYHLLIVFNIKNYNNEIQWMLDWLEPYIESDGHIGHIRYEEDEHPTILTYDLFGDKKINRVRCGA